MDGSAKVSEFKNLKLEFGMGKKRKSIFSALLKVGCFSSLCFGWCFRRSGDNFSRLFVTAIVCLFTLMLRNELFQPATEF